MSLKNVDYNHFGISLNYWWSGKIQSTYFKMDGEDFRNFMMNYLGTLKNCSKFIPWGWTPNCFYLGTLKNCSKFIPWGWTPNCFSLIIRWERENLNMNSFSWENLTIPLNHRSLNNFFFFFVFVVTKERWIWLLSAHSM